MFILLGRDPSAAAAVRFWANRRESMIADGMKPESDRAMVEEARTCADAMDGFAAQWKRGR